MRNRQTPTSPCPTFTGSMLHTHDVPSRLVRGKQVIKSLIWSSRHLYAASLNRSFSPAKTFITEPTVPRMSPRRASSANCVSITRLIAKASRKWRFKAMALLVKSCTTCAVEKRRVCGECMEQAAVRLEDALSIVFFFQSEGGWLDKTMVDISFTQHQM